MNTSIKRFYKQVEFAEQDGGYVVRLDGKAVKSPGRHVIVLPNRQLADALAAEWAAQQEDIVPAEMPVMRFVSKVAEGLTQPQAPARAEILKYAGSDLLCYRAEHPAELIERQRQMWDPVLQRLQRELDLRFELASGVIYVEQPAGSLAAIGKLLDEIEGYALAAMLQVTSLTGSALLAIALQQSWLRPDEVWRLSHLDEDYQAELWGTDFEAEARRAKREQEFRAACLVWTV